MCGGLLLSNGVIAWTFITLALAVKGIAKNINNNIKYIDITNDIKLEDYYYTDHHLRQDKIFDAVKTLSINMNFEFENNFEVEEYEPFYGAYFGQLLIKIMVKNYIFYTTTQ